MAEKTIQLLFELAINWETQTHDLYAKFAKLFSHEPKVSAFWIQLTKTESIHMDILNDMQKEIPREKLLAEMSEEQWNSVTRVEGLIKDASMRIIQTLHDAYELAHELEISEMNTLFKMLVNHYLPSDQGQEFILTNVTEHIEMLMKFGKEYTQSQRRRITVRNI